ncbi:MAG: hypothetical protein ABIU63_06665 [Chitinophagaceae bacterium]
MLVSLFAIVAAITLVVAIITFILYGRARMKEQEQKEKSFLRIHYAALFVLLLLGVVYMFFMVETAS